MRAVFIGAGELSCMTARQLLEKRYEVVVIEQDKERIDELGRDMDVGFIHGDGSKPAILREADPAATDFLFCLCGTDQYNIIASLVGRSLGYRRVITRIEDPSYEHICIELGLEDIIIPDFTIARHLEHHARVEKVLYPGLQSHPGHEVARRQMDGGFGGMLSVCVKGGMAETGRFVRALKLFLPATSLGGVESLVEHRKVIEGPDSPIPDNLVRVSVGIEAVDDLIGDLEQALEKA